MTFETYPIKVRETTPRAVPVEALDQPIHRLQESLFVHIEWRGHGNCHMQLLRRRDAPTVAYPSTSPSQSFEKSE